MISKSAFLLIEDRAKEVCSEEAEVLRFIEGAHFAIPIAVRETWLECIDISAKKEFKARKKVKHNFDWIDIEVKDVIMPKIFEPKWKIIILILTTTAALIFFIIKELR